MIALLLLKASLLLSMALLFAHRLRRAPGAVRHRLWSLAFVALLALPLCSSILPALYVPLPASTPAHVGAPTRTLESGTAAVLVVSWLSGTAAAVGALLLSLLRVRRLIRTADEIDDAAWRRVADALGARLGLSRPARLLVSPEVRTPMAGGIWHPIVFLPASARAWTAERRDVVLAHEIAHVAARDPLRHLAARLAVACYWFHPLVWFAARQSTLAREQACDEAVLALGTRRSAYAQVLLDLADSMDPPALTLVALPIAERSLLERRVMAILNDDIRPASRRPLLMPALGAAALTVSMAAAQPVRDVPSSAHIDVMTSAMPADTHRGTAIAQGQGPECPIAAAKAAAGDGQRKP